jgi:hypothetical protein
VTFSGGQRPAWSSPQPKSWEVTIDPADEHRQRSFQVTEDELHAFLLLLVSIDVGDVRVVREGRRADPYPDA